MSIDKPAAVHSKLGASSSHRWMHCPASVSLIDRLVFAGTIQGNRSSIFSVGGHLAHGVAATCLEYDQDAWEYVGKKAMEEAFEETFDSEDAKAVQVYLDAVRGLTPGTKQFYEISFHVPEIHNDFYGQSDRVGISAGLVDVWDYKHGVGIPVEVENNTQLMMYAVGAIRDLVKRGEEVPEVVRLVICQPRAWHPAGPIREWYTTRTELEQWITDEWLPAARNATQSNNPDYMAGDWCRFCPAKLDCPIMRLKLDTVKAVHPSQVKAMTDEELASLNMDIEHLMYVKKAAADETYGRLMLGKTIAGSKLVAKKADRVWKEGAEAALLEVFPVEELYNSKIKSPAQVEDMVGGTALVRKWGYKPDAGMTVAPIGDVRAGQKGRSAKDVFSGVIDAGS